MPKVTSENPNNTISNEKNSSSSTASSSATSSVSINEQPVRARSRSIKHALHAMDMRDKKHQEITLRNEWLINRSRFNLTEAEKKILKEFNGLLKATISDLFFAIKAISSGKVSAEVGIGHQIVSASLQFIPYAGGIVANGYQAAVAHKIRSDYQVFSQYLHTCKDMDLIVEEFAAIVTSYHQAEIVRSSNHVTFFESIKNFCTTSRVMPAIRQFVEKYISGKDDKVGALNTNYKEHWPELIADIVDNLLKKIGEIKFEDVQSYSIAVKLSSSITASSHAPLDFKPKSVRLADPNNVFVLARIALLAYDTERKITEVANLWGHSQDNQQEKAFYFIFKEDIQGFVLADHQKIIISFRGTATTANMFSDANFRFTTILVDGVSEKIRVHVGFKNAVDKIWPEIRNFVATFLTRFNKSSEMPEIWITGHSLGGAMATLAAFDCLYGGEESLNCNKVHLYTFGQPKVGNELFIEMLKRKVASYHRFVNYLDIVPNLPAGYTHGGELRWLDSRGVVCDAAAYERVKQQLDQYGKSVVRDNAINVLMHTDNHSMTAYAAKFGIHLPEAQMSCEYFKYICHEFSSSRGDVTVARSSNHIVTQDDDNDDNHDFGALPTLQSDLEKLGMLIADVNRVVDTVQEPARDVESSIAPLPQQNAPPANNSTSQRNSILANDSTSAPNVTPANGLNVNAPVGPGLAVSSDASQMQHQRETQPSIPVNNPNRFFTGGRRITGYEHTNEGMNRKQRAEYHFKKAFNVWTDPGGCQAHNVGKEPDASEIISRTLHGIILSPFFIAYMSVGSFVHVVRLVEYLQDEEASGAVVSSQLNVPHS